MQKIERQEALIEELTTRGSRVGFRDALNIEDSKYA